MLKFFRRLLLSAGERLHEKGHDFSAAALGGIDEFVAKLKQGSETLSHSIFQHEQEVTELVEKIKELNALVDRKADLIAEASHKIVQNEKLIARAKAFLD